MALFNASPLGSLPSFDFEENLLESAPLDSLPMEIMNEPTPSMPELKEEITEPQSQKKTKGRSAAKKPRISKNSKAIVAQPTVKENVDDKYRNRLEANKKSAQQSRERKKNLKVDLEGTLSILTTENETISREIIEMETENRVLKGEFVQLQNMISESAVLSKMMDRITSMNIPYPAENIDMDKVAKSMPSSNPAPVDLFSNTVDPTALMYMMIVLQSFNQYFSANAMNSLSFDQGMGLAPTVA